MGLTDAGYGWILRRRGAIRLSNHEGCWPCTDSHHDSERISEDEAAALAAGMNGHIAKPIEVDMLYREDIGTVIGVM